MTNVAQVKNAIRLSVLTGVPLFIEGSPGIGKSRVVRDTLAELEYETIDVRLTLKDPTDLQGLPVIKEGKTWWVPPSFLPQEDKKICIFFDELNLAPPAVQHAAYQLILDRRLQDYVLPPQARIIAAGNKLSDKTGVYDLNPALSNRFLHITMDVPSAEEWGLWAAQNKIHPDIIAFINFRPDLLWKKTNEKAWPTPRSWEFASTLYNHLEIGLILSDSDYDTVEQAVSLAVGAGAGREFTSFIKLRSSIPDVWDVVRGKVQIKETDVGMWMSVIGAITARLNEKTTANEIDEILQFVERIKPEYGIILIRQIKYGNPKVATMVKNNPRWRDSIAEKWVKYAYR